jgi:hypothetical protein
MSTSTAGGGGLDEGVWSDLLRHDVGAFHGTLSVGDKATCRLPRCWLDIKLELELLDEKDKRVSMALSKK